RRPRHDHGQPARDHRAPEGIEQRRGALSGASALRHATHRPRSEEAVMRADVRVACLLSLTIALLASGCFSFDKTYPDKRLYVLDPVREGPPGAPVPGTSLKIKAMRVSPKYEGKELVYRYDKERVESDFYEQFFVAPSPMITDLVRRWFTQAGLFENVLDISSPMLGTHLLEGSVKSLYADLRNKPPAAVVEVQFFLLDQTGDMAAILYQRSFSESVPIKDSSGPAIVDGMNQALAKILTELEAELRNVLAHQQKSAG